MDMCPVCNGFDQLMEVCEACGGEMVDYGRAVDYLDEYSPYLDLNLTVFVDGDMKSSIEETCVHYLQCAKCDAASLVALEDVQ
ncbi:hypothetical protein [Thalassobacillus hwangdonensis]|uniref:Uncharacterized protein n=1 Tax=Thalassobacillus hwangdonensis TaxID=546108 RepID=A0ABW3KY98_9BACI